MPTRFKFACFSPRGVVIVSAVSQQHNGVLVILSSKFSFYNFKNVLDLYCLLHKVACGNAVIHVKLSLMPLMAGNLLFFFCHIMIVTTVIVTTVNFKLTSHYKN